MKYLYENNHIHPLSSLIIYMMIFMIGYIIILIRTKFTLIIEQLVVTSIKFLKESKL